MQEYPNTQLKKWTIYKITNPKGECYVGKTADMKGRFYNYKSLNKSIRKQRRIYNSLVEYGFDNHTVEIIDNFKSDLSYANGKEVFWIRTNLSNYNYYPDFNGLNLGNGGFSNKGVKHTEKMNKEKSIRLKGRSIPEHQKQFLREMYKGASSPMQGKNHTQEAKDKISKSKKGKTSPHKGKVMDIARVLQMRDSFLGRESKLKGKKIDREILEKVFETRNTKKIAIKIENTIDNSIIEFRSIRKASTYLSIGTSLLKRISLGFNNYKFSNFIITQK